MNTMNDFKNQALDSLKGNWAIAIGGYLIYMVITALPSNVPFIGTIAGLILGGPFLLGITFFSLSIARNEEIKIDVIFQGFQDFSRSLAAYLLTVVYTLLWSLLLIIPGIIKAIAYSQTFFILAEDKTIGAEEAINKSMLMMEGNKMSCFLLFLSFTGWFLLSILTLGIGFLWLVPYFNVTFANFHLNVKEQFENRQVGYTID